MMSDILDSPIPPGWYDPDAAMVPTDKEKKRLIELIFTLDQLYRLARNIQMIKGIGHGMVKIRVKEGELRFLAVETEDNY
jgi:hypothetical protein